MTGTVYLLHLDAPGLGHARHYTGWAWDLPARLALHEAGQGARLLAVARAAGVGWTLARTWPGGRARERNRRHQVKIRLHGTEAECMAAAGRLSQVLGVLSVSQPYPDRGTSVLVRVYVEARLSPLPAPATPRGEGA